MVFNVDKTSLPCGSIPGPEGLPVIMNQYQNDTVLHSGVDFPEPPGTLESITLYRQSQKHVLLITPEETVLTFVRACK
jgi:hypothetical protein